MKTKNECRNVSIGFSEQYHPPFVLCKLSLSVKTGADLIFVSNTGDNEVKHIRFLSEVGGSLRSLKLDDFSEISDIKGEASKSIDRLFDILHLCPLLEECTILDASSVSASRRKSKYPSLKKLSIIGVKSLRCLNSLSLSLSSLCEFSLGPGSTLDKDADPIVINMPRSSLDLLTWDDHPTGKRDAEVYIKLKTERGLRYYSENTQELLLVDKSSYLSATENT
ncbi:hypothetical protein EDC94DRAFT_32374 [Helicostylum pulchrum]|nr:hypothetical protein EDC94DRAFT_32374 [Helicostylum pulchrum]